MSPDLSDDLATADMLNNMLRDMSGDIADDMAEELPGDMPEDMAPQAQQPPDLNALAACAPFVLSGPYKAGVTTLMVEGRAVEVWYPSDVSGLAEVYDLRDWLPQDYRDAIPADKPTTFTTIASRDVPISTQAGALFPVVLFSHGLAAYRLQSSFLTAHLATWGYVVASPDHPERGLALALTDLTALMPSGGADVAALRAAYEAVLELGAPGGRFDGKIDVGKLAVSGHSAGGAAALALAASADGPRPVLVLAYTPAVNRDTAPIEVELVAIAGTRDVLTTPASIKAYVERGQAPRRYVSIAGAGHLAPSDLCVIGREAGGILKIAQDAGLPVNGLLRGLATNGCRPSDLLVERAWPIFTHLSVAHLRRAFGQPVAPDALGQAALDCFAPLIADHVEDD
jgi:alpha-beta hydrolase superfamily lysophospholipase